VVGYRRREDRQPYQQPQRLSTIWDEENV
jgi:hypothetical protein